jgi:hypothetical protein
MAKQVYTYTIIGIGLMILLNLAGIDTGTSWVMTAMGITQSLTVFGLTISPVYVGVLALFTTAVGGGIVIGFITKSGIESIIVATFAIFLLANFMGLFVGVIAYAQAYGDWTSSLATLLLVPYMIGYMIALIDYWRGAD